MEDQKAASTDERRRKRAQRRNAKKNNYHLKRPRATKMENQLRANTALAPRRRPKAAPGPILRTAVPSTKGRKDGNGSAKIIILKWK